ncbi:MAG: hypothetical protein HXX18_08030 [Bacteroidetes bacterium]|nr:hypothetical protein [Bacteroidota bacterium]
MKKTIHENAIVYKTIDNLLQEYESHWQNMPPMVETKKRLDLLIDQSEKLRTLTGVKSRSVTKSKNSILLQMIKDANLFHSALTAYSNLSKNDTLKFQVEAQGKRLKKSKRGMDVFDVCNYMYALATTYKTALLDYGITQDTLKTADQVLKNFSNSVSLPKTVIKTNKANNQQLMITNKDIQLLLKNQLDKLINLMGKDVPDFVDKYYAIRSKNKTRGKNKKPKPIVQDPNAAAA